ncbi:MAG: hydrophobic/amphiphilic exporter-1 (mainly G- bacteria) HAE1 family [Rhodospirillaceae bacterium]|nr:MAG: hydrophobic/amphiphilic exporter-1 (mainly G- bacteria) HAE1 family [Rhodospirillaceae bacterium]
MNLVQRSMTHPVAVLAVVVMVILFGGVGLWRMPVQLTPDIRGTVITVATRWPGASPLEVEREILIPQEEVLNGLKGMRHLSGSAQRGMSQIEIEFFPGTDTNNALSLVTNRLNQNNSTPKEAKQPQVSLSSSDEDPVTLFVVSRLPGNDEPIDFHGDFIEKVVAERLARVPGVATIDKHGGRSRELRVVIDPTALSRYHLTIPRVVEALRDANIAATMGEIDEGKRFYTVRMASELVTPERVKAVLLRGVDENTGRMGRVTVGDVAMEIGFAYKDSHTIARYLGQPAISLYVMREGGTNVIEIMRGLRAVMADLNRNVLKQEGLVLTQPYDETLYVNSAVTMVVQNIYMGGLLAGGVLFLFLRSLPATLVVVLSIPISIIGAFIGMAVLGRSLNVISLAGMAFAVGMVVDAAIVVLENIFRLRQEGHSPEEAAHIGSCQVWGAILASTLTTIMVFIPVLTLDLEIGQAFRDIAVALSVSVLLSLVVAVTVIPALAYRFLGDVPTGLRPARAWGDALAQRCATFVTAFVIGFIRRVSATRWRAVSVVGTTTAVLVLVSRFLLPPFDYLPEGSYNMLSAFISLPTGYNTESVTAIADRVENALRPLWASETGPDAPPDQPPKIKAFFLRTFSRGIYIESTTVDAQRTADLAPVMSEVMHREPGVVGATAQPPLFYGMGGVGRQIALHVSGPDLAQVLEVAHRAEGIFNERLPITEGYQLSRRSALELSAPEVRIMPDPLRLADAGVTAQMLMQTVDAFNDGMLVDTIAVNGERMDLVLRGPDRSVVSTEDLGALPVVTENGRILPVSALAALTTVASPATIRHIERRRTIAVHVSLAQSVSIEQATERIQTEVIDRLVAEGVPTGMTLDLSGAASMLAEAWEAMMWQFLLALAVSYLLMVILYEDFLYPVIILITVPQATAGAVLGLAVLNLWHHQTLDMLTLLGFVILIGTVVNNAILIVHQTLHHLRGEAMAVNDAIEAAVISRLRPIFMTTLTTLFGMLPLVVFPGMGGEVYRGLAMVVLGGLSLSVLLTLLLLPPLLSLTAGAIEARRFRRIRRRSFPGVR